MQKLTRGILWALAATGLASCGDDRIGRENGNDLAVADAVSADAVSDAIIVAIADEGLPPDNEDAGAADVPDLGDPPDPPPDLGLTDGAHLCEPADASADPPPPPTLENTTPLPPIEMGGPAAVDQLFLNNLDGDPAGTPEVVVIRKKLAHLLALGAVRAAAVRRTASGNSGSDQQPPAPPPGATPAC